MNKVDELRVRASDSNFVKVITEVYPKFGDSRDILPAELQIKGYNIYRAGHRTLECGGASGQDLEQSYTGYDVSGVSRKGGRV